MRIALDLRCVFQGMGGIGSYALSLLRELARFNVDHDFVCYFTHLELPEIQLPRRFAIRRIECGMIDSRFDQLILPSLLSQDRIDLYFNPTFSIPSVRRVRTVATIHDVVFRRHPDLVEPKLRGYLDAATQRSCRSADRIVTVSEFSKREIVALYGADPGNIEVIHNGVRRPAASSMSEFKDLKYALYVGSIEPKKNIDLVLQAIARLDDLHLVLAGGKGPGDYPIDQRIHELGLENRVRVLGYVSDERLEKLYAGAIAFVYPSRYEGFGLPPLEAMARGVPTVVSTSSSLPEIVGEGAIQVDPDNAVDLAAVLQKLTTDSVARVDWSRRGKARAEQFSWETSARRHLDVFETVAAIHEDCPSGV